MIRPRMGLKGLMVLVVIVATWLMVLRPHLDGRSTYRLSRQLARGDAQARREAAEGLIWSEPENLGIAVEALIGGLADTDDGVRAESARSLGACLPPPAAAGGPRTIGVAASTLEPALHGRVAQAMVGALRDPSPGVRVNAAVALPLLGFVPAAVAPLRVILREDHEPKARVAAARALLTEPETDDHSTIAALVAALRDDPEPMVRVVAAHSLAPVVGSEIVFNALVFALGRAVGIERNAVEGCLKLVRSPQPSAVGGLIAVVRRADLPATTTDLAMTLLIQIGPEAAAAAPTLLAAYRREDLAALRRAGGDPWTAEVGHRHAQTLCAVAAGSPEFESLLGELIGVVEVSPPYIRQFNAASLLGILDAPAAPALPALRKAAERRAWPGYDWAEGPATAIERAIRGQRHGRRPRGPRGGSSDGSFPDGLRRAKMGPPPDRHLTAEDSWRELPCLARS